MSKYYKIIMIIISADIIAVAVMFLLGITGTINPSDRLLSNKADNIETTAINKPDSTSDSDTVSYSDTTAGLADESENTTTDSIGSNNDTTTTETTENTVTDESNNSTDKTEQHEENDTSGESQQFIVLSTTSKVYLREMPSTNSTIIKELYPESYGNVISVDGRWTKVEFEGTTGYVFSDYLATGDTAKDLIKNISYSKVIINSSCNMRRSPDTNDEVFGNAMAGTTYRYDKSKSNDNWYAIYLEDGSMAYISTGYASVAN